MKQNFTSNLKTITQSTIKREKREWIDQRLKITNKNKINIKIIKKGRKMKEWKKIKK